jgi:hypothetical protein
MFAGCLPRLCFMYETFFVARFRALHFSDMRFGTIDAYLSPQNPMAVSVSNTCSYLDQRIYYNRLGNRLSRADIVVI